MVVVVWRGHFGYEKKHYDVSMACGEVTLFPAVRRENNAVIAAAGISCRHQIEEGTDRQVVHPNHSFGRWAGLAIFSKNLLWHYSLLVAFPS